MHISLIINPDTDHMTLYVGDSGIEVNRSLSSHSVDFRAMLLQSLSAVTKVNHFSLKKKCFLNIYILKIIYLFSFFFLLHPDL